MKPKIYVCNPVPQKVREFLSLHCDVRMRKMDEQTNFTVLCKDIADVEGLISSGVEPRINEELLCHAPRLKVVSNMSVGYDNFDIEAMKARGVAGTNTPGVLDDTVADLVIGLMLSAARRIPELDRSVKEGKWQGNDNASFFGQDVHHAVLGMIGLGRIGESVVRRAKFGFGMEILYYNRRRKPEIEREFAAQYVSMDDIFSRSDYVVVMTPLTAETQKMIGAAQFARMKESAIFINAARGQVVDEAALVDALRRRSIYAAGLDVFEQEPVDPDNPLLKLPNAVTVPHIGAATAKTREAMAMRAAENAVAALRGEIPPNAVPELRNNP